MRAKPLNVLDALCDALVEAMAKETCRRAVRDLLSHLTPRAKRCRHPKARRFVGPRVPATYGSWATEVCRDCFSWRYDRGGCKGDRRWRGVKELAELLKRDPDEDWS